MEEFHNYHAWYINPENFKNNTSIESQVLFIAQYGVLAPSVHNTQPWDIGVQDDKIVVVPNFLRSLPYADENNNFIYLALGMVAENIITAAHAFGLQAEAIISDENISITIAGKPAESYDKQALDSILSRHSHKEPYDGRQLTDGLIKDLEGQKIGGCSTSIIPVNASTESVLHVISVANQKIAQNHGFVRELTKWIKPNWSRSPFGMPGRVNGFSSMQALLGKGVLRTFPQVFQKIIKRDDALFRSSSAIAIMACQGAGKASWIQAGMAVEALWLRLVSRGLVAHPMSGPVHIPEEAVLLRRHLGLDGDIRFVMRIGYSTKEVLSTPRKSL